jgi:hypothetical protein
MQATTSSLPTSRPAARSTISSTACHLLPARLCWWRPAGPTEETMLKRVLAANSSWCREGPRINLRHGLTRTNESRAWPGIAILIRRGGQRPWDLRRLRVERRANGSGSSVMASSWEGCWRKWELRAAVALVKGRTAASTATFLKCGAHALLGSLPVRAQWPGFKAAGPAACCQRVTSATLTAMYPEIRRVTASAWPTGRL